MAQLFHPWNPGKVWLADLHIHSHYSRATSKAMHPATLTRYAKKKGLRLVGTGDFTHPAYLDELEKELEPDGSGLYVSRDDPSGPRFMLTAEVSNIFTQSGKGRRIHTVLFAPDLRSAQDISKHLSLIGNVTSDGRPIFGFSARELVKLVIDIDPRCLIMPAHIWTPWFSLFGARSGFNAVEECFEEQARHIYCLETGLSSDPDMNWRWSHLDTYTLLSNSDAHSPQKLGRECNVFSCDLSYRDIIASIKGEQCGFEGTVEFFPEEGKYHWDGHRSCGIYLSPVESKRHSGLCPVCGNPLTLGVATRIEDMSDRNIPATHDRTKPFVHIIPLDELIAEVMQVAPTSTRVRREYERLVIIAGSEFNITLWMSEQELADFLPENLLKGIRLMRKGEVQIRPGYDGVYGAIKIFSNPEKIAGNTKEKTATGLRHKGLFA